MAFVNDPKFEDIPAVGSADPVLVAERTRSGEAVRWAPKGDADALAAFLGDEVYAVFEGRVMQRLNGGLVPVPWLDTPVVLVKPPAGDIFPLTAQELVSQYAMVDPATGDLAFIQQTPKTKAGKAATQGAVP